MVSPSVLPSGWRRYLWQQWIPWSDACARNSYRSIGMGGGGRCRFLALLLRNGQGGMPVYIGGTLSRLVDTDNEEARRVAPELYDDMDEMEVQGLAAISSERFQGQGGSSNGDAAQRDSTQTEGGVFARRYGGRTASAGGF